jgi:hypothetical protein
MTAESSRLSIQLHLLKITFVIQFNEAVLSKILIAIAITLKQTIYSDCLRKSPQKILNIIFSFLGLN